MGTIYKRGQTYWVQYYRNGKPYRESTKSSKEKNAIKLLKKRDGEILEGKFPGIYFEKIKFDELAEDLKTDYRINNRKSLDRLELSISHLNETFKGMKVTSIDTPYIKRYIEKRMEEGAANATINRELSALKRMLMLGAKLTPPKVSRVPFIPMMKESNPRKGFFEHEEYLALMNVLPGYLKAVVTFAYKVGWRKGEIINLTWSQVDRKDWIVYLNPGETKNDEGRTVYLDTELKEVFKKQWELRKKGGRLLPYLFPNCEVKGKIKNFMRSWKTACEDAGLNGKLFHDFRRTAVRNMVRAGIPERVAMMISGHKTRSVFDRYNIVNDADLKEAAQRQERYIKKQNKHKTATISKVSRIDEKRGLASNS